MCLFSRGWHVKGLRMSVFCDFFVHVGSFILLVTSLSLESTYIGLDCLGEGFQFAYHDKLHFKAQRAKVDSPYLLLGAPWERSWIYGIISYSNEVIPRILCNIREFATSSRVI